MSRCEEYKKNRSSVDVVRESDRLDLSLEELESLGVDYEPLTGTLRRPLPNCKDFLYWKASRIFAGNASEDLDDSTDDDEDHPEALESWREMKEEVERIITEPTSGSGSSAIRNAEEELREARKHLDSMFQTVGSLEEQLEKSKRRNRTLTASLHDTRQLLQADHQKQPAGKSRIKDCRHKCNS